MINFGITLCVVLAAEITNCMFPYYTENTWTENANGEYHENIGCICKWEKEDFIYNSETDKWDLAPDASRKRGKGKRGKRRGGSGLR